MSSIRPLMIVNDGRTEILPQDYIAMPLELPLERYSSTLTAFCMRLLQRMDPRYCMASLEGDLPLDVVVPIIRFKLKSEVKRKAAQHQLYDLTLSKHWENRYVNGLCFVFRTIYRIFYEIHPSCLNLEFCFLQDLN
jgi:hypothetical protein